MLDEPSIGLHQRDNDRLIGTLQHLRDLGNSVIVVEHDEDMIRMADWVVDMGPGAGEHGGQVVAQGDPEAVQRDPASLTGQYLSGARAIAIPQRRPVNDELPWLTLTGATGNNLKNVDLRIPAGRLVCVTGVSGSGKSTLVNDTLAVAVSRQLHHAQSEPAPYAAMQGLEHFDKIISVDQSPIGRTPRSNPATTRACSRRSASCSPACRKRTRGYDPGRFSFNVKGGRCEACQGDGVVKVEMHFLPDMYVPCDVCHGKRYNRETLEIRYRGRNISEVLDLTVEQALEYFESVPAIARKLHTLIDVGLSYIRLGQSATTLSGGEAQRVKLSLELSRRSTGRTLYILDEPTTGLHFRDIELLLQVLNQLVDSGNTVLIIEHNLDVIKTADWLVDMGPEGGDGGGRVVAQGTPETVAAEASHTGHYLGKAAPHGQLSFHPHRTRHMYTLIIGNKNLSSWSMRPWRARRALPSPSRSWRSTPRRSPAAWAKFRPPGWCRCCWMTNSRSGIRWPSANTWPTAIPRPACGLRNPRARPRAFAGGADAQRLRRAAPGHAAERGGAPARRRILRRRPAGHLPDSGSLAGRARAVRPGRTVPVRRLHHRRCVLRASGVALHHLWRQRHRRRAPTWTPCWRTPPCRNGSATRRPKRPRDRNRGALRRLAARQRAAGPHQTGARSIAQAVAHEGAQQSHRRRLGAAGQCHQRELRMAVQRRIQHQLDQLPDRMPSRAAATMPRNTASDARTVSSRLPISSQRRRTAVLGSAAMP